MFLALIFVLGLNFYGFYHVLKIYKKEKMLRRKYLNVENIDQLQAYGHVPRAVIT